MNMFVPRSRRYPALEEATLPVFAEPRFHRRLHRHGRESFAASALGQTGTRSVRRHRPEVRSSLQGHETRPRLDAEEPLPVWPRKGSRAPNCDYFVFGDFRIPPKIVI